MFDWLLSHFLNEQVSQFGAPSTSWTWVFAIGIFAISSLGIYAACSENVLVLKIVRRKSPRSTLIDLENIIFTVHNVCLFNFNTVSLLVRFSSVQFAGFMGTGMVIMLIFGIYVAVMKSKVP